MLVAILSPRHPFPAPPVLVLLVGTEPDSAILLRENIRLLVVPREDEGRQLEVHICGGGGQGVIHVSLSEMDSLTPGLPGAVC